MAAVMTLLERHTKTLKDITDLMNLWRSGKITNDSTLAQLDGILRKAK